MIANFLNKEYLVGDVKHRLSIIQELQAHLFDRISQNAPDKEIEVLKVIYSQISV